MQRTARKRRKPDRLDLAEFSKLIDSEGASLMRIITRIASLRVLRNLQCQDERGRAMQIDAVLVAPVRVSLGNDRQPVRQLDVHVAPQSCQQGRVTIAQVRLIDRTMHHAQHIATA